MRQRTIRWIIAFLLGIALAVSATQSSGRTTPAYASDPTPTPTQTTNGGPGGGSGQGGT